MGDTAPADRRFQSVRQLVLLAALMIFMYLCSLTLCFTHDSLNLAFACVFLSLPLFGLRPAFRLRRWPKILALAVLIPLLAVSIPRLLMMAVSDIPDAVGHLQLSRDLCTLEEGKYSINLIWEETAGGAGGPHGVSLEQRRNILPGLYAVKYLDYL